MIELQLVSRDQLLQCVGTSEFIGADSVAAALLALREPPS